jgi:hypothetical protein
MPLSPKSQSLRWKSQKPPEAPSTPTNSAAAPSSGPRFSASSQATDGTLVRGLRGQGDKAISDSHLVFGFLFFLGNYLLPGLPLVRSSTVLICQKSPSRRALTQPMARAKSSHQGCVKNLIRVALLSIGNRCGIHTMYSALASWVLRPTVGLVEGTSSILSVGGRSSHWAHKNVTIDL